MNMKNEDFFGTDTLIAFRLLKHILSSGINPDLIRAMDSGTLDDWTERARQEALLWDILWGDVSFGGGTAMQDRYHERQPLPLEQLLHWSGHFKKLDAMQCKLNLSEQDISLYESTSEFQAQIKPEKEMLEQLKKKEILVMPLSNGREFAIDLVRGRQEIVMEATDGPLLVELREKYRPVALDFSPMAKVLMPLIDGALEKNVSLFKMGKSGSKQNVLQWGKQRERMMRLLKPLNRDYHESWCTLADFTKDDVSDGARPIETLLTMEIEGDLVIEGIAANGSDGVKIKVDTNFLFGKNPEKEDVAEDEKWVECADFQLRRKPLSLKINGIEYGEKNTRGKAKEDDNKRRKALRVLEAFSPKHGERLSQCFQNLEGLARKLGVSVGAAKTYKSKAKDFLQMIGSKWTISDGRNDLLRLEERTRLPRNAKKMLPKMVNKQVRRES